MLYSANTSDSMITWQNMLEEGTRNKGNAFHNWGIICFLGHFKNTLYITFPLCNFRDCLFTVAQLWFWAVEEDYRKREKWQVSLALKQLQKSIRENYSIDSSHIQNIYNKAKIDNPKHSKNTTIIYTVYNSKVSS